MGLLDYYRQFDDIGESEYNKTLRARRAQEKALALEMVPTLDLSGTEWPDLPDAEVVSASVYQARGRLHGYPDPEATKVRRNLAERHNIRGAQIAIGNGAAEFMRSAIHLLAAGGGEVVVPRPSQPLYATLATRAGIQVVEPGMPDDGPDIDALARSVTDRTRVLVLCNPNDPTGAYVPSERLGELLSRLPEHVHVLLDEAYIHFQDIEPIDACMSLVADFPRLLVFRTFSKVYGMAGLRAGYVIGSTDAAKELEAIAPPLGVNGLTQVAIEYALSHGDGEVDRRRNLVIEQRKRVLAAMPGLPVDATLSQGNFLWMAKPGMSGAMLASRLENEGVIVAPGGPLGADDHVRVSIRGAAASERLVAALEKLA